MLLKRPLMELPVLRINRNFLVVRGLEYWMGSAITEGSCRYEWTASQFRINGCVLADLVFVILVCVLVFDHRQELAAGDGGREAQDTGYARNVGRV